MTRPPVPPFTQKTAIEKVRLAEDPTNATSFDRNNNIGLHHSALQTDNLAGVAEALASRNDMTVEFAPEGLGDTPIRNIMVRVPGNIRLELIQP